MKKGNIAIITARGGSKRIPRKNIRSFLGKPILIYSIEAATMSGCFEEVMVSTDDDEIAKLALKANARVPFKRSQKNSSDHASTADVIFEVIEEYSKLGKEFESVCCIYPTAPFVTAKKLQDGMRLLKKFHADSVVPVVRFSFPIQRAFRMENEKVSLINPEHIRTRSQDLEPHFQDAGQFYWLRVSKFMEKKELFTDNTFSLEMSELEVQDIDKETDWKIAEVKFILWKKNKEV